MSFPSRQPHIELIPAEQLDRIAQLKKAQSEIEGEALRLFEEMPSQSEFFRSSAMMRLIRGGNRSGKTSAAAVEVGRCALKRDPHKKYPTGRNNTIYIIGYDQDHAGRVIYPKLFEPGAFKVIRDLGTGKMRAFRPADIQDQLRLKEAEDAPPIIPERYIVKGGWAWHNKADRSFSVCRLTNGTEIRTFSSKAQWAPQGAAVDLIWIDEDIEYARWIGELQARLADRGGKLIWSVFPHSGNDALVNLSRRAEETMDDPDPSVKEWVLTFSGNPHIPHKEKKELKELWAYEGETELAARDRGEFSYHQSLMYPMFDMDRHGIDLEFIPPDWTRYLAVDPGHTRGAALFIAVPPPEHELNGQLIVYDELAMPDADARKMAKAIKHKGRNDEFAAFVIDEAGSRGSNPGTGIQTREYFRRAFTEEGLYATLTGFDFHLGTKDKLARNEAVRMAMRTQSNGHPKLRVLRGKCPGLEREIARYRHKRDKATGLVLDEPDDKGVDITVCLQYLISYEGLIYRKPKKVPVRKPQDWLDKIRRRNDRYAEKTVYLA